MTAMEKLKLSAVPDDKPVKLAVELPAAVVISWLTRTSSDERRAKPSNRRSWSHRCWPASCRQTEPSCERAEKSERQADPAGCN
jgi:Protein of unknown function (DUF2274)